MIKRLGFMQGRLSPVINGKIQAFPSEFWEEEFPAANKIKLGLMEWTLDYENLYENPLMTEVGQKRINELSQKNNLKIPSLTGDCFMQEPFFKKRDREFTEGINDFINVVKACGKLGIKYIVFPLVDNSSINDSSEEEVLLEALLNQTEVLSQNKVKILFESDFEPQRLKNLIDKFPKDHFGINYDTGNSASLGYSPVEEISLYGDRVLNVHIKDRKFKGTTVPLGEGDVDFENFFAAIKKSGYEGNFIFQTARAKDGEHDVALKNYMDFIITKWQL